MARTLEEMIGQWEEIARHAATYDLTLDDWLNDLDLRDIIDRHVAGSKHSSPALTTRLDAADRAFREATLESRGSLWGPNAGATHDAKRQWWYFRYPKSPGAAMRADLKKSAP